MLIPVTVCREEPATNPASLAAQIEMQPLLSSRQQRTACRSVTAVHAGIPLFAWSYEPVPRTVQANGGAGASGGSGGTDGAGDSESRRPSSANSRLRRGVAAPSPGDGGGGGGGGGSDGGSRGGGSRGSTGGPSGGGGGGGRWT